MFIIALITTIINWYFQRLYISRMLIYVKILIAYISCRCVVLNLPNKGLPFYCDRVMYNIVKNNTTVTVFSYDTKQKGLTKLKREETALPICISSQTRNFGSNSSATWLKHQIKQMPVLTGCVTLLHPLKSSTLSKAMKYRLIKTSSHATRINMVF